MNVYITRTSEFSEEKLNEVICILKRIDGKLNFEKGKPLTSGQSNKLKQRIEGSSGKDGLSFNEYFELIQDYRDSRDIDERDFIILITSIRNKKNWFSAFDKKNIFVHGEEWDIISDVDSKFGIAYQCVENIFQSLMGLDIMHYKNDPNIHKETIGCINDFCAEKTDILRKFQSGNICSSCLYVAEFERGVDKYIFIHIIQIIEEIRKEFVVSKHLRNITKLEKVKVDEQGSIFIGTKKLKLATMPKVLYLGFLKQIEGFPNDKLCINRGQFDNIYKFVKPKNRDDYSIEKMLCNQVNYPTGIEKHRPTFETYRTRIKDELKRKLGDALAHYYAVKLVEDENHKMLFKVNLSKDQIDFLPDIT